MLLIYEEKMVNDNEGIILGRDRVEYSESEIFKEFRIRKIDSSDAKDLNYSVQMNNGEYFPFVLECRYVGWKPLAFAHSEDDILGLPVVKTIESISYPKLQEIIDEETRKRVEAEKLAEAKKMQKEAEFAEYLEWLNTHVQAQCKATKGVKRVIQLYTANENPYVDVSAIVYGKSIAVHKTINGQKEYGLTQVSSGKLITKFSKLEVAKKAACVLYREVQWANDSLEMSKEEKEKATEIISAFKFERKPDFIDLNSPPKLG